VFVVMLSIIIGKSGKKAKTSPVAQTTADYEYSNEDNINTDNNLQQQIAEMRRIQEMREYEKVQKAAQTGNVPRGPRITKVPGTYYYDDGNGGIIKSYLSPDLIKKTSNDYKAMREYYNSPLIPSQNRTSAPTSVASRSGSIPTGVASTASIPPVGSNRETIYSGEVIRAVTVEKINSDFPSYATAKITSPPSLVGGIILLKSSSQSDNRISITPVKVIFNKKEYSLSGIIRSGLPGMTGSVNRHLARKTVNPLAAVGLMAYGTVFGNNSNIISTEDAIRAQIIGEGINLGVNEMQKYSGDVPNTVTVPSGTPFEVLLIDSFSFETI